MNKDLKNSIIAFSELADAMSQQGYPGNSEKLKIHMVLVSVAIAAAEGAITEKEMQCIRDYLDYPLTSEILHEKILPNRLDYILTEPPSEIEGFVASEKMAGADGSDAARKNADMFVDVVEGFLDEMISSDGSIDENETWVKDTYMNMLKESVEKMRTAE